MKIVVIGGGASGIVAAICSKSVDNEVVVLEKNSDCLKKLLITGNGKCNYFNDDFSFEHYYSDDVNLLSSIINCNNKSKILNFFSNMGIVPRIKNGYYYPYSNQAYTVHNALLKEASIRGVCIFNNVKVLNIEKNNGKFLVKTSDGDYIADRVVISTGSLAYPKTGSDGDGYRFGEFFGHTINKVYPSLVQLISSDKFLKKLAGVRSDVEVSLICDSVLKSERGEIQFADYGISGICVYNLSCMANKLMLNGKNVMVYVNFFKDFDSSILELLDAQNKKVVGRTITELLECFLNYKIVNVVLDLCKIEYDLSWDNITYDKKNLLEKYLVSFPIKIVGSKGFDNSQVCAGGISLKEIDMKTFESKKVSGLYFTGEVLDVCGDCGGYNLGFAFLSGMLVGEALGGKYD